MDADTPDRALIVVGVGLVGGLVVWGLVGWGLVAVLWRILMASITDLNAKADQLQTTANEVLAKIQTPPPAPVATQADLDALGTKLDAVQTTLNTANAPAAPTA